MLLLRPTYPLKGLLMVAGLASSTFYYQRKALAAPDKHADLKVMIEEVFTITKGATVIVALPLPFAHGVCKSIPKPFKDGWWNSG